MGRYQAQHMISVFGYSFAAAHPPATPSPMWRAQGPSPDQRSSGGNHLVAALWTAVQNYNAIISDISVTVIS